MALFELREGACMHAENSVPQNSAAHQVTHIDAGALQLYTVGCFLSSPAVWGLVRVLPFLCCWSALEGRISILECAFWGFLLLFALLHLFPLLSLVVTYSTNQFLLPAIKRLLVYQAVCSMRAYACTSKRLSLIHI